MNVIQQIYLQGSGKSLYLRGFDPVNETITFSVKPGDQLITAPFHMEDSNVVAGGYFFSLSYLQKWLIANGAADENGNVCAIPFIGEGEIANG